VPTNGLADGFRAGLDAARGREGRPTVSSGKSSMMCCISASIATRRCAAMERDDERTDLPGRVFTNDSPGSFIAERGEEFDGRRHSNSSVNDFQGRTEQPGVRT
jgi:hypothetical protein